MAIQQRPYDVDELWELYSQPEYDQKRLELRDGLLVEISGPGGIHGRIATKLARFLDEYAEAHALGDVTVETGYHPRESRYTLLLPDVAFIGRERAPDPFPEKFIPLMPDIAVEIRSPNNTLKELREKAQIYLRHGAKQLRIVLPAQSAIEFHRPTSAHETLNFGDSLSGEDVLPGFHLE